MFQSSEKLFHCSIRQPRNTYTVGKSNNDFKVVMDQTHYLYKRLTYTAEICLFLQVLNLATGLESTRLHSHRLFNTEKQQAETYCRLHRVSRMKQSLTFSEGWCVIIEQRGTAIRGFKPSATFIAEHSEYEILLCHRWAQAFQVENTRKLNYIFIWFVADQLQFTLLDV